MKRIVTVTMVFLLLCSMLATLSFSVSAASTDILNDKKVLVVGDDISSGLYDSGQKGGWSTRLMNNYGMKPMPMHASAGVSISDWRKVSKGTTIGAQVAYAPAKGFDYVLLHGGMADAETDGSGDTAEGVVTGGVRPNDYTIPDKPEEMDAPTFADGMERLIVTAIKKYNGVRIGFIINYATPNNNAKNARDMERYWTIARQVCEKWNVPYLDLYAGKTADGKSYSYDILDMDNPKSPNHNNNKHLRAAGYDVITPYIAEWMTTIQPYDLQKTLATAPTTTTSKKRTTTTTTSATVAGNTTTKAQDAGASVVTDPAITTTTTEGDATTTTTQKAAATNTADRTDVPESTPENSSTVVEAEGGTGRLLTVILTAVTVAAAIAVLAVLGIVVYKRFKS